MSAITIIALLSLAWPTLGATIVSPVDNATYASSIIDVRYNAAGTACNATMNGIFIPLNGCNNFTFAAKQGTNTLVIDDGVPAAATFRVGQDATPPPVIATQPEISLPLPETDQLTTTESNPAVSIRNGDGKNWFANITISSRGATIDMSTMGSDAVPRTNDAKVRLRFAKRHVKNIDLDGVNLSGSLTLGYDEPEMATVPAPAENRALTFVYAIDPTQVQFTNGTVTTIASGTELYKCRLWDFSGRSCIGSWEKMLDTTPGVEYNITITPDDPGFAEAITTTGASMLMSITNISVYGSIPSPLFTGNNMWGAVVFNPTNRTINITRVRFIGTGNIAASIAGITPAGTWTRATATELNWTGSAILGPNDAQEFIVMVAAPSAAVANILVSVNVTTNDTNASVGGYMTATSNVAVQYPSVYFLNASNNPTYVQKNIYPNVTSNYTVRINNSGTTTVGAKTQLVLYIPPGWLNTTVLSQANWYAPTVNGDEGTGWMIAPSLVGPIAAGGTGDYTFNATPPDLDDTYVYHGFGLLLGPSAVAADSIMSSFSPAYQAVNLSTKLLDANDNRFAITKTNGGATTPEIFMSVPAPAGRGGGNRWGAVVVNPTDSAMTVTELNWTSDIGVFGAVTGSIPGVGWVNISTTKVRWSGTVTVPAHGASEFIVLITGANAALVTGIINVTAITNIGILQSGGLTTQVRNNNLQYPTIYSLDPSSVPTYIRNNLVPGTPANITLRVDNTGASVSTIPATTNLVIYLPPGWTNINPTATTGWNVRYISNDTRGPNVIMATNNAAIAVGGTLSFGFNATPPNVGTNSSYRLDAWLIGDSSAVATAVIKSNAQICLRVVPTTYGINITRKSSPITNVSNVSSLTVVDIAKAMNTTAFNFSILNVRTGNYETINASTLGTTKNNYNITITINSTNDPRNYINGTVSTGDYGKILVRWYTNSSNNTALYEDWLFYNVTFHQYTNVSVASPVKNVTLNAGTTKTVLCNGSVTALDGNGSIRNVSATFYLNGTSPTAQDSNFTHYTNASCLTTNVNGTSVNATCTFSVWFYATNGTWLCNITTNDSYDIISQVGSFLVDPLYAISVSATKMNFGNLTPGNVTSNMSQNITNAGNQQINVSVYGYGGSYNDNNSFTCLGQVNLSLSFLHFAPNITANYSEKQKMNLSASPGQQLVIIPKQSTLDVAFNMTYWQFSVPNLQQYNNLGFCNGTLMFQAN